MADSVTPDERPLSDDEVGKLYALCLHDTKAYNLLRRLVKFGQIPDPEPAVNAVAPISSKLKSPLPCPFCGLAPDVIQARNAPLWWIIKCMHADCEIEPTVEREGREAAIAAWNKRSSLSEPTSAHETAVKVTRWHIYPGEFEGVNFDVDPTGEWVKYADIAHLTPTQDTPKDEAQRKASIALASLYQVIGALASDFGVFDHPDVQRALDVGSRWAEMSLQEIEDLLPWPRGDIQLTIRQFAQETSAPLCAICDHVKAVHGQFNLQHRFSAKPNGRHPGPGCPCESCVRASTRLINDMLRGEPSEKASPQRDLSGPDHPRQHDIMSIESPPGTRIQYMDCNGYPGDVLHCRKAGLVKDQVYEVVQVDVFDCHSNVRLKGFDGWRFNTVCFCPAVNGTTKP